MNRSDEARPIFVIRGMIDQVERDRKTILRIDIPERIWRELLQDPLFAHPTYWNPRTELLCGYPVRTWDGISKVYIEAV